MNMTEEDFSNIMDNSNFMIDSNNIYDKILLHQLESGICKKPERLWNKTFGYYNIFCPRCKKEFKDVCLFCSDCGQAIDWGYGEEKE